MCYLTEAGISALGVFVMLDEAGISALGGKRVNELVCMEIINDNMMMAITAAH